MYRHCIYCSAGFGANEALEGFPVGRTLAFDAGRGRLWAVCARCARWNLAPIEERWEAVEQAERLFRDARLRVQSENIGLARLPDGTRLIRVGAALAGELAAWRYGEQIAARRRRYLWIGGAVTAGVLASAGAAFAAVGIGAASAVYNVAKLVREHSREHQRVLTIPLQHTPHGQEVHIQRKHLSVLTLEVDAAGGIEIRVPKITEPRTGRSGLRVVSPAMVLPDRAARRVLERGMIHVNAAGAGRKSLARALDEIATAGSAEEYIRQAAVRRLPLIFYGAPGWVWERADPYALALEMALHEEQERRALEGELAVLEAAWRDAEEIAGIADRLAAEPPEAG